MMRILTGAILLGGAILSAVIAAPSQTRAQEIRNCAVLFEEAQRALRDRDVAALEVLYEEALRDETCSSSFVRDLGKRVAALRYQKVLTEIRAGKPRERYADYLEETLTYARLWQISATLGEIALDRKDYGAAQFHFEQALDAVDNPDLTPEPGPSEEIVRRLMKNAETARLLAPDFVATPTRGGRPTGLGAPQVRGIKIRRVAVPIRFGSNSRQLTGVSLRNAEQLFINLRLIGTPDITLIGHSDSSGPAGYNMTLSIRRARTVADFLKDKGYTGAITVTGKGETEPYQPDNPDRYSREERLRMDRRVEICYGRQDC